MFPDARKFVDGLASKIKHHTDSHATNDETEEVQEVVAEGEEIEQLLSRSMDDHAAADEQPPSSSSPPSIIANVASKLSSPPPLVADVASKLKLLTPATDSTDTDKNHVSKDTADQTTPSVSSSSTAKKTNKLASKGWNIKMLPVKEHIVAGHLVPALRGGHLGLIQKRRRVMLEILPPEDDSTTDSHLLVASRLQQVLDEGTTLLSSPMEEEEVVLNKDGAEEMQVGPVALEDGATIVLRCMKVVKKGFFAKDTDAEDEEDDDDDGDPDNEWTEYKRYGLDLVEYQKTVQGTYVEIRLGAGSETVVRDFHFGSETEAKQFVRAMEACKSLQTERAQRQIRNYQQELQKASAAAVASASKSSRATSSISNVVADKPASVARGMEADVDTTTTSSSTGGDKIQLLVEIVSGVNLPAGDMFTSDPYVIVRMGNKEVHRTEYLPRTLDPIWTLQTGSLFLIVMTPEEFFASAGGMSFIIKDFDAVGPNEILGRVTVKLQDLLKGTGERVEYDLLSDLEAKKNPEDEKKQGKLVLRYKVASQDDVDFMEFYTAQKKNVGALAEDCFLPPKIHPSKLLEQKTKTGPNKEVLFRVKPTPDPLRVEETTWMTKENIDAESLKASTNWIEVGSGDLGRIYVEVLGCDSLTVHDGPSIGPGTDINAFACLIFEDCIVNTDVINDDANPKWMPWSQRAFMFHIRHPSSQLMLGMFTLDEFLTGAVADSGSPIGRVVIPLTNFCPSTNYTLQFPLHTESGKDHSSGTVKLRVRIEWQNERQALIASVSPRSPIFVSVAKRNEFAAAYYTTAGTVEPETTFAPAVLSSYIEELTSYLGIIDLVLRAATTVILWRGTCKVGSVLVPVHSITAFVWGVLVTQNFNRLPSFWLFSIAWFFLATKEYVRSHPSKWHRCRSYIELFQILALSKSFAEEIAANDNLMAIAAREAELEELKNKAAEKAEIDKKRKKEEDDLLKEEQLAANATEVEITSFKKAGIALNPLGFLFPVQKQVGNVVVILRIVKSIVLWQENYLAFWLVTVCLAGSIILFFVPFGFILRWTSRIVVWVTLGPWMKLVDVYYVQKQAQESEDISKSLQQRQMQLSKLATLKQINRERALKLKDMTMYLFGKYLLRVPRFKEDRSPSYPLPPSCATTVSESDKKDVNFSSRYYGQHLLGDMVPQRDVKILRKDAPPKSRGIIDPAKVPLLSSFGSKTDYGAVPKANRPLSFLFGKR